MWAIDKGAVLSRKYVPIFKGDTLVYLYKLCFQASFEATVGAISKLKTGAPHKALGNDGIDESYYSYPDDGDWKEFKEKKYRLRER